MQTTSYFAVVRLRPDRVTILDEWIQRAISDPFVQHVQADGRIRRWVRIAEMDNRFPRVVLLPDGATVHNAFFDRRFQP